MAMNKVLAAVLARLLPGGAGIRRRIGAKGKRQKSHVRRQHVYRPIRGTLAMDNDDVEAATLSRRRFADEAAHSAINEDYDPEGYDGHLEEQVSNLLRQGSLNDELERIIEERKQQMTYEQMVKEEAEQAYAIKTICQATSLDEMIDVMDVNIDDDWLGGLDELPGNIYSIGALRIGEILDPEKMKDVKTVTRKLGFIFIFIAQLVGPVLIFLQHTAWVDDRDYPDQIQWEKWEVSLTDWRGGENSSFSTKFMAFVFLSMFVLNGLFCHLDEWDSWLKVDYIFRCLQVNGEMKGTCECMLQLGAFMNCWVIFWLNLDVFISLGVSDSVNDVLMDALGLTFIYNLDDIAGDLGFVDKDDWPGTQLAWVNKHMKEVANKNDDVFEVDPSTTTDCFLCLMSYVLGCMVIVLPILFIVTPFYDMKIEPWYENSISEISKDDVVLLLQRALANNTLVQAALANVTLV